MPRKAKNATKKQVHHKKVYIQHDDHNGEIFVPHGRGKRSVGTMGNAGVTLDFGKILKKMGYEVIVTEGHTYKL